MNLRLGTLEVLEKLVTSAEFQYTDPKIQFPNRNIVVVTPNLNHLSLLSKNHVLRNEYLQSDYLLPDGMPLVILSRWIHRGQFRKLSRFTGVESTEVVLSNAKDVYIIGSSNEIVSKIEVLYKKQNNSKIKLEASFEIVDENQLESFAASLSSKLHLSPAKDVLVCLGFPKQEKLALLLSKYEYQQPKNFFCVGGSLDMLSGTFPRAPIFLQKIGAEWLWRLSLDFRSLFPRYRSDFLFLVKFTFQMLCFTNSSGRKR